MPIPFENIQGNGVFDLSSSCLSSPCSDSLLHEGIWQTTTEEGSTDFCYVGTVNYSEPTSVLDAIRSPSPLTSSSTLSSSHGGSSGITASTDVVAAISCAEERCGQMDLEDWGNLLSGSSGQELSILSLIMGDVENPTTGFGVMDPGFGFGAAPLSDNPKPLCHSQNTVFSPVSLPLAAIQDQPVESLTDKHQISNPVLIINRNQAHFNQNPALFVPLSNVHSQENYCPPPAKRLDSSYQLGFGPDCRHPQKVFQFPDPFKQRQQQLQQRSTMATPPRVAGDDQSAIIDQLFKAAELIETGGDSVLAQGILARLNHHLNSIGKTLPFQKAASYVNQALQLLFHQTNSSNSSQNLILKIAAQKAFSETYPFLQFTSFTCNQAFLESFDGFDRIHIIDFDLGFGGQWASLMEELVLRNGATPPLKITAFASPSTTHEELELRFAEENLKQFASEIKIPFEIEILNLGLLLNPVYWPLSIRSSEKEAIAVHLPVGSVISGYLILVLRFLKQISPNIVVSADRGCDRSDAAFAHSVIHAVQYHSSLLESLEAVSKNSDALQKIESFWVQPSIEKLLLNRRRRIEKSLPWRTLFLQCGFSPASFSNLAEAQAECLVQRSSERGFHVEKRQSSSLVLCWQRKELVAVSAWRIFF